MGSRPDLDLRTRQAHNSQWTVPRRRRRRCQCRHRPERRSTAHTAPSPVSRSPGSHEARSQGGTAPRAARHGILRGTLLRFATSAASPRLYSRDRRPESSTGGLPACLPVRSLAADRRGRPGLLRLTTVVVCTLSRAQARRRSPIPASARHPLTPAVPFTYPRVPFGCGRYEDSPDVRKEVRSLCLGVQPSPLKAQQPPLRRLAF